MKEKRHHIRMMDGIFDLLENQRHKYKQIIQNIDEAELLKEIEEVSEHEDYTQLIRMCGVPLKKKSPRIMIIDGKSYHSRELGQYLFPVFQMLFRRVNKIINKHQNTNIHLYMRERQIVNQMILKCSGNGMERMGTAIMRSVL